MDKKRFSITIGQLKPLINQRRSFSEALRLAKKKAWQESSDLYIWDNKEDIVALVRCGYRHKQRVVKF